MAKKEDVDIRQLMDNPSHIRNLGIIAHINHGKTSISDSLLAGAGLLSMKIAGKALATNSLEEEKQRGITILASAVTMVHEYNGEHYLVNLIDTPGHIDFGGEVTRSLRAVDGAVVVVCAVDGIMPQTETVLKQAIRERVKPVLFINKVDRLIKELKLTPEKMQERFITIITKINKMISQWAPPEYKELWQVKIQDNSVAFGSAFSNWALSADQMAKTGLNFKKIIDSYEGTEDEVREKVLKLAELAPVYKIIMDMTIKHHPSPIEAQKYRVPHLWRGDLQTPMGKSLVNCDPKGKALFVVTQVITDPTFGELSFGRVFSGTLKEGQELIMADKGTPQKAQRLFIMVCDKRVGMQSIPAGCTAAIIGLRDMTSGQTLAEEETTPFEAIKHIFDSVVTKAIEPKDPNDLPKLIQALREVNKEDPTVVIKINEETGENLISGLGELHLEDVIDRRIVKQRKVNVKVSPPIVVYREGVKGNTPTDIEGKSPNKHNKFYIKVKPLEQGVYEAIKNGNIAEKRIKKKDTELWQSLFAAGMDKEEAKSVKEVFNGNVFVDNTSGEVHLIEVMETVLDAFEAVMKEGPLAREQVFGVKVELNDVVLHEDAIHRGPAQVIPAMRDGIKDAFRAADPIMMEPIQKIRIDAPMNCLGNISKLLLGRRGQLLDTEFEGDDVVITGRLPVAESFGFMTDLRSATMGRGVWSLIDSTFERVPKELQPGVIEGIRTRKGLTENQ
ncbi:Elongation factor 2 [Candidatus Tiddalikarchaeum anstoanum]|nr:Elongation factor 2 [Candidatus Tiddalikarchaeum anstoanum]